jgi:radical SAM protein with 4Fe4S-binding SPASM domain
MEQNRPYKHDLDIPLNFPRNDAYYDKVFEFSKKYHFGFHPMIYYGGIENWIKNFDWFQEQFAKHGIGWRNIYLLQVRNDGWTVEANKELYKFIQHIINFAFDKVGMDKEAFVRFLREEQNGFNILSQPLVSHNRGIGCGLQNTFGIRVSDLAHHVCHRNMYPDYCIGSLVDDEDGILRYETKNAELGLVAYGFNTKMQPACIKCPINHLCIGGCLGAQYEINRDLFSPIKSVCQNSWWLMKAIIDGFERIGVLDLVKQGCAEGKNEQIEFLRGFKVDV